MRRRVNRWGGARRDCNRGVIGGLTTRVDAAESWFGRRRGGLLPVYGTAGMLQWTRGTAAPSVDEGHRGPFKRWPSEAELAEA
jgi:hypothetical protein